MRTSDSFLMWYLVAAVLFVAVSALWLNRKPLRAFFGQPLSGMGRGDKLLVTAATLVAVFLVTPFFYPPLYAITYGTLKAKEVRVIDGTQTAICLGASDAACTEDGSHYLARHTVGTDTMDFYIGSDSGGAVNWKGMSNVSGGTTWMELDKLGLTTVLPNFPNGLSTPAILSAAGFVATSSSVSATIPAANRGIYVQNSDDSNKPMWQVYGDGELQFIETGAGNDYVGFQAPAAVTSSETYLWPGADGSAGDSLQTDGAGNLSWAIPPQTVCKTVESLTTADTDVPLFAFNGASTITKYSCSSTGAVSISLEHWDDDDDVDDLDEGPGAGIYACVNGTADAWITSFTAGDQTFDDTEVLAFDVISGTPTWTVICFAYTTP